MRIVAGAWRGRTLVAPAGQGTRPTADRVRQALFDMLMHAEWGGRAAIDGAVVLDVFAGTGALGLEALSRGAASACFIEQDAGALKALRANVTACKAGDRAEILAVDALAMPRVSWSAEASPAKRALMGSETTWVPGPTLARPAMTQDGSHASLVFLDPPYGRNLVPRALARLREVGRIGPDALVVAEIGGDETWKPEQTVLAERQHGAARILIFRAGSDGPDCAGLDGERRT
jgi:16S rRNA (guanine966-N2)-methyltransferase